MYKIIIKAKTKNTTKEIHGQTIDLSLDELNKVFPIKIDDNFVSYYDSAPKGLIEGYNTFQLIDNEVWIICEYLSKHRFTDKQLNDLVWYTEIQWNIVWGSSFEYLSDIKNDNYKIYISMSEIEDLTFEQIKL